MKISVVNVKADMTIFQHGGIYIGRGNQWKGLAPSPLANRFVIGIDGTREVVIEKYEAWLKEKIRSGDRNVLDELARLSSIALKGELVLACWCAPLPCHGDVIKKTIEEVLSDEEAIQVVLAERDPQ